MHGYSLVSMHPPHSDTSVPLTRGIERWSLTRSCYTRLEGHASSYASIDKSTLRRKCEGLIFLSRFASLITCLQVMIKRLIVACDGTWAVRECLMRLVIDHTHADMIDRMATMVSYETHGYRGNLMDTWLLHRISRVYAVRYGHDQRMVLHRLSTIRPVSVA